MHLHLLSYSQPCIDECDFPLQSAVLDTHLDELYFADLKSYLKIITVILSHDLVPKAFVCPMLLISIMHRFHT